MQSASFARWNTSGLAINCATVEKKRSGTRALERGLNILNSFHPGVGALHHHDFVERTGLPKATVTRLVATLVAHGYLVHDHAASGYRLGAPVLSLARALQIDKEGLVARLAPAVHQAAIELGAIVGFGTLHGAEAVYLVVSNRDATRRHQNTGAGMRVPVLGTGVGIACVAAYPLSERERITAPLRSLPTWRQGSSNLIARAARQLRERGYCEIAYRDGHSASVAAPVVLKGGHVYAFTISYPVSSRLAAVPAPMLATLKSLQDLIPAEWRQSMSHS